MTSVRTPEAEQPSVAEERLRIAVLLKTSSGGLWVVPQVEELRRRGHDVTVVLPPADGRLVAQLRERGFRVVAAPFDFAFGPNLVATAIGLWRLRRLIRQLRVDVVNYHLYASALAVRLATVGMPILRVHMVAGPLFLESSVIRPMERLLWRLDDVIVCGTGYTGLLYGRLGCPVERRPVVTCGVDTDHFSMERAAFARMGPPSQLRSATPRDEFRAKARAELGLDQDVFLVVMVAYVYPPRRLAHRGRAIKGHDILLEAWRTFHTRHPRSHLLLVGAGWTTAGERHRRDLIHQFGLDTDPSVTWTDSLTDVRPCYHAADISVSPSLSEGHGAVVEASAMGVPSIVSDAGGLPETVDQTCGWVVPRGDPAALTNALETAYHEFEAGRLDVRGDRARRRAVRLFDSRNAAAQLASLIERECPASTSNR